MRMRRRLLEVTIIVILFSREPLSNIREAERIQLCKYYSEVNNFFEKYIFSEGVSPTGKIDFGKHMKEQHGITLYDEHDNVPVSTSHIFQETSEIEYSTRTEQIETVGVQNDGYESDESSNFHERV